MFFFFSRISSIEKFNFKVDCPSGELSKSKLIEVYQQLFPQGHATKFCEHIFRTFDIDNSGKIDFK
jgi:Ca2+-binding EF-hand superfamily protein